MSIERSNNTTHYNGLLAVVAVTLVLLLIPVIAMQFTDEVNWDIADFLVMFLLLSGTGSIFVLITGRARRKYRVAIGITLAALMVYLWAELAVGIFTGLGS